MLTRPSFNYDKLLDLNNLDRTMFGFGFKLRLDIFGVRFGWAQQVEVIKMGSDLSQRHFLVLPRCTGMTKMMRIRITLQKIATDHRIILDSG